MDNPFVLCPYEPAHRVLRSRIQGHIVKCEKKYPKLGICPYNATHRLPESELRAHIADCPSKVLVVEDKNAKHKAVYYTPRKVENKSLPKPGDEDYECWD